MQLVPIVEVLEPADSQDLVTLEIVKAYLNITVDTEDERIKTLITFASSVIAGLCDRVFGMEKVREVVYLEGEPGGLNLSRYPLVEVESITLDGTLLPLNTWVILDAEGGIVHGAVAGMNEIIYTAGYDLPEEAPGPLSQACLDFIRGTYYAGGRDPLTQSITDNATGSIRFFPPPGVSRTGASAGGAKSGPLSPQATALIQPYKKLALA